MGDKGTAKRGTSKPKPNPTTDAGNSKSEANGKSRAKATSMKSAPTIPSVVTNTASIKKENRKSAETIEEMSESEILQYVSEILLRFAFLGERSGAYKLFNYFFLVTDWPELQPHVKTHTNLFCFHCYGAGLHGCCSDIFQVGRKQNLYSANLPAAGTRGRPKLTSKEARDSMINGTIGTTKVLSRVRS